MNLTQALADELVRIIAEGIWQGLVRDHVSVTTNEPDDRRVIGTSAMTPTEWARERARNIVMGLPDLHAGALADTLGQLGETMQRDGLHLTIQPGKRFVCQVVMGMPPRHAAVKTGADITEAVTRGLEAARVWTAAEDGRIS